MAKLSKFGKVVEPWKRPQAAAPLGYRQNQTQRFILHKPTYSFHLAGTGARPRSCGNCAPDPGNTAEVAGEGASQRLHVGQGGQETGLWPKAGGGRKLTQYLREHPVALSLKRTLSGPWVLSAGWAREAMQSPQDFGGLGVGPADLGSPTVLPLSRPSPPPPASPTPAGSGSALPVKARLAFSSFCVPYKALASVAQFFSNPLNFKNRH